MSKAEVMVLVLNGLNRPPKLNRLVEGAVSTYVRAVRVEKCKSKITEEGEGDKG